jgi:hypothetical protein
MGIRSNHGGGIEMTRVLAAHQPNYAPYLGFFHKARHADVFVLQDDLKYVKNDFGNRNRIQSEDDWRWLTIPVHAGNESRFNTATAADSKWGRQHANILRSKYLRATHEDRLGELIDSIAAPGGDVLSDITIDVTTRLLALFEIDTPVVVESTIGLPVFDNPNDRLISLCERFECDVYVSGLGGHAYIDEERWAKSSVRLEWSGYEPREYGRGSAPWIPDLSALDAVAHADDLPSLIA